MHIHKRVCRKSSNRNWKFEWTLTFVWREFITGSFRRLKIDEIRKQVRYTKFMQRRQEITVNGSKPLYYLSKEQTYDFWINIISNTLSSHIYSFISKKHIFLYRHKYCPLTYVFFCKTSLFTQRSMQKRLPKKFKIICWYTS